MSRSSVEQGLLLAWGSITVRRSAGESAINRETNNKAGFGTETIDAGVVTQRSPGPERNHFFRN